MFYLTIPVQQLVNIATHKTGESNLQNYEDLRPIREIYGTTELKIY